MAVMAATLLGPTTGLPAASAVATADQGEGRNDVLRRAFRSVGEKAARHVVHIRNQRGRALGYGTVVAGGEGPAMVVTALRVVRKHDAVVLLTADGRKIAARVQRRDQDRALALLSVEPDTNLPAFAVTHQKLEPGAWLVSVGVSAEPLAVGVVSALDRRVEVREQKPMLGIFSLFSEGSEGPKRPYAAVIQHDSPITSELYGSPVVSEDGQLLGINVDNVYRGSSYALGTSVIEGLIAGAPVDREPKEPAAIGAAYLGVTVEAVDGEDHVFARIVEVLPGHAADKAGLQSGDVIEQVADEQLESLDQLGAAVRSHKPGDTLKLGIRRGEKLLRVDVTLTSRPRR